jgi:DNA-binding LacI/PurR family transcriptional regulator
VSKGYQIYQHILDGIKDGLFAEGDQVPKEIELASQFNISRATVARALRKLEEEGIIERRKGLGTYVRQKQTSGLSFALVAGSRKGNLTKISDALSNEAQNNGYGFMLGQIILEDVENMLPRAKQLCQQYMDRNVVGVFFIPMYLTKEYQYINRKIVEIFENAGIHVILMDRDICEYPQRSEYDLVGIDNPTTGFALTEHLLSLGYKRIEFIAHTRLYGTSTITGRIVGYQQALRSKGITPDPKWIHIAKHSPFGSDDDLQFTDYSIKELLHDSEAEAFICASDGIAATFMSSIINMGISIPEDFAVVGIDDDEYGKFLPVKLTTMRQPCAELGEMAVRLMQQRLESPNFPPVHINLQCKLIVRESCGSAVKKHAVSAK